MTSLLRMCNEISEPASVTGRSTLEEMDPEVGGKLLFCWVP